MKTTRGKSHNHLPPAELDVMTGLASLGEATAGRVREQILRQRPMTHGSVATLLKRLEKKGLVTRGRVKIGKAHVFAPTRKYAAFQSALVTRLIHQLFADDPAELIASVLSAYRLTAEQRQRVLELLQDSPPSSARSTPSRASSATGNSMRPRPSRRSAGNIADTIQNANQAARRKSRRAEGSKVEV